MSQTDMFTAYIGLGANLGEPQLALTQAVAQLKPLSTDGNVLISRMYRSAPVDATGPDYINAVACFTTRYSPTEILHQLQDIEHHAGRERLYKNAPRTLDLDLLLYGDQTINLPALTVPHPRMHQRAFVLLPLSDLAPHLLIPGAGLVSELVEQVKHQDCNPLI